MGEQRQQKGHGYFYQRDSEGGGVTGKLETLKAKYLMLPFVQSQTHSGLPSPKGT